MRYVDDALDTESSSPDDEAAPPASWYQPGWRYTARPQWSSKGESMWMRLSKFSLCNRVSVTELVDLFALKDGSADDGDLRRIGGWDREALAHHLEISVADAQASFCSRRPRQILTQAATQLRYCEACLIEGFHAAWFQWLQVERCPLHDRPLRSGCFQCSAPIPYVLGMDLALSPLCCARCRCAWVPPLFRPAGQCLSMARRERERLRQWADYVNDVITVNHRLYRDRHTGRYIAAEPGEHGVAPARPHVLTMVNRLFDTPPPLIGKLTTRFTAQRRPPSLASSTKSADASVGYDRRQWPHFADDFARCERLVRSARSLLFAGAQHEFETGCWRQLLLDGLVTPTSALRRDAATAAGWTASWLGASHLARSVTDVSAPAFGLVGWLAHLPLREAGTSRGAWHVQVLAWLRDDLELSAWAWSRMTAFMSSKRMYLLYGEAVSTVALATRHAETAA